MYPRATVARLGGDEFAVLIDKAPADGAMGMATRITDAFGEPFVLYGHELPIRISVGLAQSTGDASVVSAATLMTQARMAMNASKRERAGQVQSFEPEMAAEVTAEPYRSAVGTAPGGAAAVQLLGELRQAIDDDNGLTVVYQPKIDLRYGDIVGVEALVRWQHPERGLLRPDKFLPLVRQRDLMESITDVVLRQALDDVARWHGAGVGVSTAVNLFAPSLSDEQLPDQIAHEVAVRGLRPEDLTLEITEDLLLHNMKSARSVVDRLREHGIRVAIDDFGSGYSGLWYLRDLPVDELKVDRRYIAPLLHDPRSAAIVRAVVDLSHELGVTTVAEGVENAEVAERLRSYGCDIGQGYHYSEPLTGAQTFELLSSATQARV